MIHGSRDRSSEQPGIWKRFQMPAYMSGASSGKAITKGVATKSVAATARAHRGAAYAARHRRRGDGKMPSRPPLLTLMPLAIAPKAPKWRRWFGVDIKRK
jgi:hypothetical protein